MSDCDPMDCSPPGFSAHGIFQAGILQWVVAPYSRGSSQARGQTQVSCMSCTGRRNPQHRTIAAIYWALITRRSVLTRTEDQKRIKKSRNCGTSRCHHLEQLILWKRLSSIQNFLEQKERLVKRKKSEPKNSFLDVLSSLRRKDRKDTGYQQ